MTKQINEENIRVAAYYIWEQAGRPEGADKECWIKAVEQLFAAKPACKKVSCKKMTKTTSKVVAKPAMKKTAAKPALKTKTPSTMSASSLNMPFYGAKKK